MFVRVVCIFALLFLAGCSDSYWGQMTGFMARATRWSCTPAVCSSGSGRLRARWSHNRIATVITLSTVRPGSWSRYLVTS